MDVHRFVELVTQALHPQPYTRRATKLPAEFHLMLSVRRGLLGRYALVVSSWDSGLDGTAFLASRRRAARRNLGALWALREVGLYLVVCGARSNWGTQVAQMPADKTGLHAVILQAVHCVDLETGESHLNQSAWGPVTFGGVDSIAPIIEQAVAAAGR